MIQVAAVVVINGTAIVVIIGRCDVLVLVMMMIVHCLVFLAAVPAGKKTVGGKLYAGQHCCYLCLSNTDDVRDCDVSLLD